MKIHECLKESVDALVSAGVESAVLDAEVLIAHICGMERHQLKVYPEREISPADIKKIHSAIKRRSSHEPVAYITGSKEFYSLIFEVNSSVLIPRPETELLVDLAVYYAPRDGAVLDLCTGSGIIAVSLKYNRGDLHVMATDISREALAVAERNSAAILGEGAVDFYAGDLFSPVDGMSFDCILSNPPYVDPAMKAELQKDLQFEPDLALFAGSKGTAVVDAVIGRGREHLNDGGIMIIEIGESMKDFVLEKGVSAGFSVSVMNDYGGLPRVAVLKTS